MLEVKALEDMALTGRPCVSCRQSTAHQTSVSGVQHKAMHAPPTAAILCTQNQHRDNSAGMYLVAQWFLCCRAALQQNATTWD